MLRKTKEEKELQGTYEPSRGELTPVEFDSTYMRAPTAPEQWPPAAQVIWQTCWAALKSAGYMAKVNVPAVRAYCYAVYQRELAESRLLELGEDGICSKDGRAWYRVLETAEKTILAFGAKFGFTPYDAVKIPKIKKEIKPMSLLK